MLAKALQNFQWHRTADRWGPRRLVVAEIGTGATKLVAGSRDGSELVWDRAKLLPEAGEDGATQGRDLATQIREFDPSARYVSVIINVKAGMVRLLNFPGQPPRGEALANQVRQTLGVDDTQVARYAVVRHKTVGQKSEYTVLAAALPPDIVDGLSAALLAGGLLPVSLVPGGVALANLAEADSDALPEEGAVGFLSIGKSSSTLLLYADRSLALARLFRVGSDAIVEAIMAAFDLDYETALKLFESGSFDFSGHMTSGLNSWMHQVGISLDFIERRHGRRVEALYVHGSGPGTKLVQAILGDAIRRSVEVWPVLQAFGTLPPPDSGENCPEVFALALGELKRVMERGVEHGA